MHQALENLETIDMEKKKKNIMGDNMDVELQGLLVVCLLSWREC
jgi:hypothetical protein